MKIPNVLQSVRLEKLCEKATNSNIFIPSNISVYTLLHATLFAYKCVFINLCIDDIEPTNKYTLSIVGNLAVYPT